MKKIVYLAALLVIFFACQTPQQRSIKKANTLLNMSEIFIKLNQLDRALLNAKEALGIIDSYYKASSTNNPELEIAYVKAHLTIFEIDNYNVFKSADYRGTSYVRLPYMNQYKNYKEHVVKSKKILTQISNKSKLNLSNYQSASIHHLLANINSYDLETIKQAEENYYKSYSYYQKALLECSDPYLQDQIKKNLSLIIILQARVHLLQKQWLTALSILEQGDIGKDLNNFKNLFNGKDVEKKHFREGHLNVKLKKFMLHQYQENLSYRIVCYYNLKKYKNFYQGLKILDGAFPEISEEMLDYFDNKI